MSGVPGYAGTLLRWHRELVRRRWTYPHRQERQRGLDPSIVELIVRLAGENRRWGYQRIAGECAKLGITVSATSVRNVLRRHRLGPAPRRGGPTWMQFLQAQASGVLACDFLAVETIGLSRLYVAKAPPITTPLPVGLTRRGALLPSPGCARLSLPDPRHRVHTADHHRREDLRTASSQLHPSPWRTVDHVEAATLGWVDWFNHHRLLEVNGDLPPVELEEAHYRHTTGLTETG